MNLYDLLDQQELEHAIRDGYVVRRFHNDHPLAILNYTDKAQFDNVWTETTRQCRGLIYNARTLEVVARPFPKFFNYGQPGADEISLDEPAYVTDKMDGSLGIAYRTPDGKLAIATRGSFHSEQAEWATAWLRHNLAPKDLERLARWTGTYTDLFEIIYPENRIVLDYGERAELVYLASVHVHLGEMDRFPGIGVPTPHAPVLAGSLRGALAIEPRENAEGVVVMTYDGRAVKLKQEDYLLKHRARFNLTPKRIWEAIGANITLHDFLEGMPDEFHDAIKGTWEEIEDEGLHYANMCINVANYARGLGDRKTQAGYVNRLHADKSAGIFAALDGDTAKLSRVSIKRMEPTGPEASQLIT